MWIYKNFKTLEAKNKWIEKNRHKYQYVEIFVNNGYCLEVRKKLVINC